MSEKTEKTTQDKFEDAAFSSTSKKTKVAGMNIEVGSEDVKAKLSNLDVINSAFKRENTTVKIPNPQDPDDPILIHVRQLTPHEMAVSMGSAITKSATQAAMKAGVAGNEEDIISQVMDDIDHDDIISQKARAVAMAVVDENGKHAGLQEEDVLDWNYHVINFFYRLASEGRTGLSTVDAFPAMV